MQPETKSLIMNIVTGALVLIVVIVGYFVFVRNKEVVSEIVAPSEVTDETIMVGTEINKTFKDLDELKVAVEHTREMLDLPEFKTLNDFSVAIPVEKVGRVNPFIPASWKAVKKE